MFLSLEFEIVAPYEVDRHGRYVSHAVAHHQRRKRSLEDDGVVPSSTAHFRVHALGQDFHMELEPSLGLVAPGFTIQTLGKNGTERLESFDKEEFCFYQGSLRSDINSSVALSTCAGMVSRCFFFGFHLMVKRIAPIITVLHCILHELILEAGEWASMRI